MWEDVELQDVRMFLVLADELHFGRTAARLGVTSSRVSQRLRVLERRVGGELFARTSRRVQLTALGQHLHQGLTPAYEALRAGFAATREAASGVAGTLRLGLYTASIGGPHLLAIVRAFRTRYPGCEVELFETGLERPQLDWLLKGDADALVLRMPYDDPAMAIGPTLSREPRVLLVAADHPLARRESVNYDDLVGYAVADVPTLPRELLDALIPPVTPSGHRLRRIAVHGVGDAILRAAAGEIVHPTVPSLLVHFPRAGVVEIPLVGLPSSTTALVWLAKNPTRKVTAFAEVAASLLPG